MLKKVVRRTFRTFGLDIRRAEPTVATPKVVVLNPIQPWRTETAFRALADEIRGRTLVQDAPLFILYNAALHARELPGDVAEVGVYKGGTAKVLSRLMADTDKWLHLFDTFEGMPETDAQRDWHKKGDFSDTSLDGVRALLDGAPRVSFHPGFFPATAGPVTDSRFAFVHIDVDIYRSVYDCCEFFYPRMVPGGIMLFDDYGFTTCPGAKLAIDEFFSDKPEQPFYLPTGQSLVTRHPAA